VYLEILLYQSSSSRSEAIKREEKRGCSMRLGLGVTRVDRYTGYIRYTGICLDTGLAILTI
jgi:hypothetical protein